MESHETDRVSTRMKYFGHALKKEPIQVNIKRTLEGQVQGIGPQSHPPKKWLVYPRLWGKIYFISLPSRKIDLGQKNLTVSTHAEAITGWFTGVDILGQSFLIIFLLSNIKNVEFFDRNILIYHFSTSWLTCVTLWCKHGYEMS